MSDLEIRRHESVPMAHFDALYATNADPWSYQTSAFEAEKRARTLQALGGRTFEEGLELGCSIGVLTADLAPYCTSLTGVDGSKSACDLARNRLAHCHHVKVLHARIPEDLAQLAAPGELELIVLSEILYFFSASDMKKLSFYVMQALKPGGLCVVVNFDGDTEAGFTGLEAATLFTELTREVLRLEKCQNYAGFQVRTFTTLTSDGMPR